MTDFRAMLQDVCFAGSKEPSIFQQKFVNARDNVTSSLSLRNDLQGPALGTPSGP